MVVVDQRDDPHRLLVVGGDGFLDQRGSHQATHGFTAVGMTMFGTVLIELLE